MAEIKPFKGYIYNSAKVKDMAMVLAPPYDVISREMQDDLYRKSRHNVVRLILTKGDKDKYKRAKAYFEDFIAQRVLIRDKEPVIYVYGQEYDTPSGKKERLGFIALMKLEDPKESKVLPHEKTFANPKKDRLNLMKQARANLSSIFSLFVDDGSKVAGILEREARRKAVFDVYYDDVRQRLWRISDPEKISEIKRAMAGKQVFIADGHHRYETALLFRDKMKAKEKHASGEEPYDYVMMYFTGLDDAKLTILATHRAVKDAGNLNKEQIIKSIGRHFKISEFNDFDKMQSAQERLQGGCAIGMYCGNNSYYLLNLEDVSAIDKIIKLPRPAEWKRLDVTVLHKFILGRILKIKKTDQNIAYFRDAKSALEKVKSGDCKLAFFLNPTKLGQVKTIAEMGEKMPHKSTYFYPKLLSGIVINKFD